MKKKAFSKANIVRATIRDMIGFAMQPHVFKSPFGFGSKTPKLPDIMDELKDTAAVKSDAVSIVKIKNRDISGAVKEAVELLGGITKVTEGKNRIMLKPNMISHSPDATTNPLVVDPIIEMLKGAGKEVFIGEGTATAEGFNQINGEDYRTKDRTILAQMQQSVFDVLGYSKLAEKYSIELFNLHLGEMETVQVENGLVFKELSLSKVICGADMVCSIPMLKTHGLSVVSLGMKNLFGLIPGSIYGSVRGGVHDLAAKVDKTGTNAVIMDLFRTVTPGLVVVDGTMAMEGDGPLSGDLVPMNLIIAGTNALATDMIGAAVMGFNPYKIPTFQVAHSLGLTPNKVSAIEVRGERVENVWRRFIRPRVFPYRIIGLRWGHKNLDDDQTTEFIRQAVN